MARRNEGTPTASEVSKAADKVRKAEKELSTFREESRLVLRDEFLTKGGCETCHGRGWVVTWDTLDSLSGCYAEYGPCPAEGCTPETRKKTGLDLSHWSKYDGLRGTPREMPEWFAKEEEKLYNAAESARQEEKAARFKWSPSKGKLVEVVKAAPRSNVTPVGTKGRIFWCGENSYGTKKFGIKDEKGETWWVTEKQIVVIDPNVTMENATEVRGIFVREARSGKASEITVVFGGRQITKWCPNSAWMRSTSEDKLIVANWWLKENGLLK